MMKKPQIFIINGAGLAGKDTFIRFLIDICKKYDIDVISSVEEIKTIANEYFDWRGVKDTRSRKLLSDLKDLQTNYCDGPFNYIEESVEESVADIIFILSREPKEIDRLKTHFDAKTILVSRNNRGIYGNHADDNVDRYIYDFNIFNVGTLDDLYNVALKFARSQKWVKQNLFQQLFHRVSQKQKLLKT